jgi:hypothetical protein
MAFTSDYIGPDPIIAMVDFIMKFATDLALQPKLVKSRRFTTDLDVRAALRALPDPPVALSFLDLGVVQNTANQPRGQTFGCGAR